MSRRGPSTLPHHILPSPPPSALPPVSATLLSARHYPPSIHEANLGDIRSRPPALATIPGPCPFLARLRAASLLPSLPLKAYIILGLRPIRSLDAHRFVWSLARHNTTPRLPGRRVLSLHYAYSPGPSIYSPQRLHPCGLSRPCDLAYQHTYTLLSVLRTCHARALLPDARSPRFGLSSPGTNNIIYPASALSLKKRAAMIHVILSLMRHTYVLRFARPSLPLYTLYLFLPCLFLRAACGVPSVSARCCPITLRIRSLLQPSAPRRMAPYTTVVRSLEYDRCPSPPQRCPYPRTTTTTAHPSIYAAQYSTPRTPTLASIIAPPLRTTLRYATLHSSHGTSPLRTTTLRAPPSSFLHFHGSSILA